MTPIEVWEGSRVFVVDRGKERVVVSGGGEKPIKALRVIGNREGGSVVKIDSGGSNVIKVKRGEEKEVSGFRFLGR